MFLNVKWAKENYICGPESGFGSCKQQLILKRFG